jgi:hypothetical protein
MNMENNKTREIDLIELFNSIGKSIGNFFVSIYNAFWWMVAFCLKRYIWILAFGAAGLIVGTINVINSESGYKSTSTIRTNAVRSYEMKEYFDELNNYFPAKNHASYDLVKEKFDLDSVTAKKISSIKSHFFIDFNADGTLDAVDFKDNHSKKDTINVIDSLHLLIETTVTDPVTFSKITNAIEYYINNIPFLISKNKNRLNILNDHFNLVTTEINYLDSLQKCSYFGSNQNMAQLQFNNREGFILGENRQQLYHYEKERLQLKKNKLADELALHANIITVLMDFPIVNDKIQSDYFIVFKYIVLAFIIGVLILLMIYIFNKNYRKYLDQV